MVSARVKSFGDWRGVGPEECDYCNSASKNGRD